MELGDYTHLDPILRLATTKFSINAFQSRFSNVNSVYLH